MKNQKITEKMIRECNDYLNGLDLTDNELIGAGCEKYPEDIVVPLVYTDDVELVIKEHVIPKKTFEQNLELLLSKYSTKERLYISTTVLGALADGEYLATIGVLEEEDITEDVIYDIHVDVCKGIDREKEQDRQTQIKALGEIRF